MKHELDCRQVSRLISEGLDTALPTPQRARLRLHLVVCQACRNVKSQMDFLRKATRELGSRPPKE